MPLKAIMSLADHVSLRPNWGVKNLDLGVSRECNASSGSQEGAFSMKLRIASLSLLTVCYLTLVVAPAMAGTTTVYSNPGPAALTTDAWTINFGLEVSDSFTLASGSSITGLWFIYWDASSGDILTTVNMALGTTSFGGAPGTTVAANSTFLGTNAYGYNLFQADATGLNFAWSGAGYLTLANACSLSGCSVSNPIYWDESKGSSTAYENTIGSIPSESFTLFDPPSSGTPGTTPEPSSIMLFGSGILGLAGVLRRRSKG
jgi:hypothetical protein